MKRNSKQSWPSTGMTRVASFLGDGVITRGRAKMELR